MHTSYWELLFNENNLKDVIAKLNGEAEVFYRKASIKEVFTHKNNEILKHKKYQKEWQDLNLPIGETHTRKDIESKPDLEIKEDEKNQNKEVVEYQGEIIGRIVGEGNIEIIKDKRYTQDKFFFHCPITLNFKSKGNEKQINNKVNKLLAQNSVSKDINIIGIDRGEKHLLYYSIIDQKENIIKQGSLNQIDEVPYHEKLDTKRRCSR